jgi:indole-3-glycerol phosphate synthase
VLLEAFDKGDLRRCAKLLSHDRHLTQAEKGGLLFGVNTRNLRTLEVDPRRLGAFSSELPRGATCVAESGIRTAEDASVVRSLGYEVALVGTALMRSADPARLVKEMRDAGRRRANA